MMFVCVVAIGTFVMAPAELGEPARICVALHWRADLAQREGGGGDCLRLERQQHQHKRQERTIQCEWRKGTKQQSKQKLQTTKLLRFTVKINFIISIIERKTPQRIHNSCLQFCLHAHKHYFYIRPAPKYPLIFFNRPPFPVLFIGNEVRAGWETRCDAITPGNSQLSVSGEPSCQTDCGGESMILFSWAEWPFRVSR